MTNKQQVIVLGGGETFDKHEDYLHFLLHDYKFDPYKKRLPNWKENLQKDLRFKYDVIHVPMPNKLNAKYNEWCLVMDKVEKYIKRNPIFVGHSLGGLFLIKYLDWYGTEPYQPWTPKATMIVASPSGCESGLSDFAFDKGGWWKNGSYGEMHFFHSQDDAIVPYWTGAIARTTVPAKFHTFKDRGHFIHLPHFPELVSTIRKVSSLRP